METPPRAAEGAGQSASTASHGQPGETGQPAGAGLPETKTCPRCAEEVRAAARVCRFCGHEFDQLSPAEHVVAADAPRASPSKEALAAGRSGSRRRKRVLGGAILVALLAGGGFFALRGGGSLTPRHTIAGTLQLTLTDFTSPTIRQSGSGCEGAGGYADISEGVGVSLRDGDGKLLAASALGPGRSSPLRCTFAFTLENVPEVPFYTIEVGRRGGLSHSLADVRAMGWSLQLSLGD